MGVYREGFGAALIEPTPLVTPAVRRPSPSTVDENMQAAVQLVLESIPDLAECTIRVPSPGAPAEVSWTLREVRVVETRGALTLTRE